MCCPGCLITLVGQHWLLVLLLLLFLPLMLLHVLGGNPLNRAHQKPQKQVGWVFCPEVTGPPDSSAQGSPSK